MNKPANYVALPRSLAVVLLLMMFLGPLVGVVGIVAEGRHDSEDRRTIRELGECELVQIVYSRAYLQEFALIFEQADESGEFAFDPEGRLPDQTLPPNVYQVLAAYGDVCEDHLPVPPPNSRPTQPPPTTEPVKAGEHRNAGNQ